VSNQKPARTRMKVTKRGTFAAMDLLRDVLQPGQQLLGPDAGAQYHEVLAGHRFIVNRLACGGVCIKERAL